MNSYPITPVPKPRMTRADKWKKRDCVMRYRAFCDEVRLRRVVLRPGGDHVIFVLPMPASWSLKKRKEMNGQPHSQTPDADNCMKALMDAIFGNDAHIWDFRVTKLWGYSGLITIQPIEEAA